MENRVGDERASSKELAKLMAEVASVHKRLRAFGIDLQPAERRAALRMWDGTSDALALVVRLAKQNGVAIKNFPLDAMADDLAVASDASKLEDALSAALQTAADTRLQAESEAMQGFFAYYNRLAQMSETDAALANELKPATDFMATGRRRRSPTAEASEDSK